MFWNKVKAKIPGFKPGEQEGRTDGKGIILFRVVEDAIKAEKIIQTSGCECKLVAPPPHLRKGCDLALEIDLVVQPVIERLLADKVQYVELVPLRGTSELLQIEKVTYLGDKFIMVKAGNMKLTFDKDSGIIVNTSGGGCPDIPYLNIQMAGKNLNEVPRPKEIGFTLCALMLDRAYLKALTLWEEGKNCCL